MRKGVNECERHRGSPGEIYIYPRCAHFGNRFVVQISRRCFNGHYPVFVDYVEDLEPEADGKPDVLVEGHYVSEGKPERADELWDWLNDRMLADEAPDPEKGS